MAVIADLDPSLITGLADGDPWSGGTVNGVAWTQMSAAPLYRDGLVGALEFSSAGPPPGVTPTVPFPGVTTWVVHVVGVIVTTWMGPPGVSISPDMYLAGDGAGGWGYASPAASTGPLDGPHLITACSDGTWFVDGVAQTPVVPGARLEIAANLYPGMMTTGGVWQLQRLIAHDTIPATLAADMDALVAQYVSPPGPEPEPPGGGGTLGPSYYGPVARAVFGSSRADHIPGKLFLGWLDPEGAELGSARIEVANTDATWGETASGVANITAIDGGVAGGAWTIAGLGLFDAAVGGAFVIRCDLAEPITVAADDPLLIAAGSVTITAA